MDLELAIQLGLNCNFSCNHCLNSSYPGNRTSEFNESDFTLVSKSIETTPNIGSISFTGGEPLLYIEWIERICAFADSISGRKIRKTLTTNASLASSLKPRLAKLNLDGVLVSFDTPHKKFIGNEEISNQIDALKDICPLVEITSTFHHRTELQELTHLALAKNVRLLSNASIKGGRNLESHPITNLIGDGKKTKVECPNIDLQNNSLKIYYVPRKGFSFCCGPAIFQDTELSSQLFSKNISQTTMNSEFKTQCALTRNEVDSPGNNDCERCLNLRQNSIFQKYSSFLNSEQIWDNVIPIERISQAERSELTKYFRLRLIGTTRIKDIPKIDAQPTSEKLTLSIEKSCNQEAINDFVSFADRTFFQKFDFEYSQSERHLFSTSAPAAFQHQHLMLRHRFGEDKKTAAIMVLIKLDDHPWLKHPTWHVGYWGIDPSIKDRALRHSIKAEWFNTIADLPDPDFLIGVVDDFNISSQNMAKYFNGTFHHLRLDPRSIL